MSPILLSTRRPHTDNIKATIKKIEVRKRKPNQPTPFPCYIYEAKAKNGCGKVIGEFVCDDIITFTKDPYGHDKYFISDSDLEDTCLTEEEIYDYGKGKPLYGWHISELKIYDKPKELSKFMNAEYNYGKIHLPPRELKRSPQSWCYVGKI